MRVAANSDTIDISMIARIGSRGSYRPFLKEYKALGWFECRAGRIGTLKSTIIKRFIFVGNKRCIVLASFRPYKQGWIISRR